MHPATKIAIIMFGVAVQANVCNYRLVKRHNRLLADNVKRRTMISYLATMIDRNDVPITQFDKIALTALSK